MIKPGKQSKKYFFQTFRLENDQNFIHTLPESVGTLPTSHRLLQFQYFDETGREAIGSSTSPAREINIPLFRFNRSSQLLPSFKLLWPVPIILLPKKSLYIFLFPGQFSCQKTLFQDLLDCH